MPRIVFVTEDEEVVVGAALGSTIVYAAVTNGVEGVEAQCGGALACGTCHVRFRRSVDGLPEMREDERNLLEATCDDIRPGSRLGGQVVITHEFDGAVLEVP